MLALVDKMTDDSVRYRTKENSQQIAKTFVYDAKINNAAASLAEMDI